MLDRCCCLEVMTLERRVLVLAIENVGRKLLGYTVAHGILEHIMIAYGRFLFVTLVHETSVPVDCDPLKPSSPIGVNESSLTTDQGTSILIGRIASYKRFATCSRLVRAALTHEDGRGTDRCGLIWFALCVRARVCVYVCASWCVRPFAAQFAFQTKYVALVDVVIKRIVIFCDGCLNNRIQQNHQRCRLSRVSPARVSRLSCSCVADVKQQLLVSYAWLCKYC